MNVIHIYANYPIREIHSLNLKENLWDDTVMPSTYIQEQRERQIKDKIFISERIKASEKLSVTIEPLLKIKVNRITSDLKFYLSN